MATDGYARSCNNALIASCGARCYPAACAVAGEALVHFLSWNDIGDERILSESYQATIPGKPPFRASAMRIEAGCMVMLSVASGSVVITLKILPAVSAAVVMRPRRCGCWMPLRRRGPAQPTSSAPILAIPTPPAAIYELQKAPAGYTAMVEPGSPRPGQTSAPAAGADEYDGDGLAWLVVVLCILVVAWVVAGYLFAAPCWGPARERLHVRRRPWQLACFCGMEPSFLVRSFPPPVAQRRHYFAALFIQRPYNSHSPDSRRSRGNLITPAAVVPDWLFLICIKNSKTVNSQKLFARHHILGGASIARWHESTFCYRQSEICPSVAGSL
jgi:hypothetical protein